MYHDSCSRLVHVCTICTSDLYELLLVSYYTRVTCEARKMNVQAVVVLHLQLVDHQWPVYCDSVGFSSLHRQAIKLNGWKAEAVCGGVVSINHCCPRSVHARQLCTREVCLRLSAIVDRVMHLLADLALHNKAGQQHTCEENRHHLQGKLSMSLFSWFKLRRPRIMPSVDPLCVYASMDLLQVPVVCHWIHVPQLLDAWFMAHNPLCYPGMLSHRRIDA